MAKLFTICIDENHSIMNNLPYGMILIAVVALDQALAVPRITAPRSKRALNCNVFKLDNEIETDKGIAKRETKVRHKRAFNF